MANICEYDENGHPTVILGGAHRHGFTLHRFKTKDGSYKYEEPYVFTPNDNKRSKPMMTWKRFFFIITMTLLLVILVGFSLWVEFSILMLLKEFPQ